MAICCAVVLLLFAGCGGASYEGDPRAEVTGTVTLDGNPLPSGIITFVPVAEGRRANGLITDGTYTITEEMGPNLGKYKVQILGYAKGGSSGEGAEPEDRGDQLAGNEEEDEEGGEVDLGPQILPANYNTNTTLEVEITADKKPHDFPLTSE